jgi:hypothetical protein
MSSDGASAVRPLDHVVAATQGTQTILLDVVRGQYYTLNETASEIWALLCRDTAPSDIAERLADDHKIPADVASADVSQLLADLERLELVSSQRQQGLCG